MKLRLLSAVALGSLLTLSFAARGGSAEPPIVPEHLVQQALAGGTARVIVRLDTPFSVDAELKGGAHAAVQRQNIAATRELVKRSLGPYRHRISRQYDVLPFLAVEAGPDALQALEALKGAVLSVQEDGVDHIALAESGPVVQAPQAWAAGLDGTGSVVAVLDTGVLKTNPFLTGKVVAEACFSSNTASSTSVCPGGATTSTAAGSGLPCPSDVEGCDHGTHVSGIVAGGATGTAGAGVAPGARIVAVQVFSRFSAASGYCGVGATQDCALTWNSDQLAGLEHVFTLRDSFPGKTISSVNMSIGGGGFSTTCDTDARKDAIDTLRAAGVATAVASGNNGYTSELSSPACISSAVSVGSTNDGSDGVALDTVSYFSNSASFLSLLAPGMWIRSSVPTWSDASGFATWAGTSMATPHVAAAFAILRQAAPAASIDAMLSALQTTGTPIRDSRNGLTKPRINIHDAVASFPGAGAGGDIEFDAAAYSVAEDAGAAVITVRRSGATATGGVTVQYATANGTALTPADYTASSGTLTFAAGETTRTFSVPIVNDTLLEGNKTVNLSLSAPGGGGALGAQSTAVLTIVEDDAPGTFQFSSPAYSVAESAGSALITVTRTGTKLAGGVRIHYASANGTALAGSDYTAVSGDLTFAAGVTTMTFKVPVTNDLQDEPDESVNLALSVPAGSPATLGAQSTAILTIVANDAPIVQFGATAYRVTEGYTSAIRVTRTYGLNSQVTVDYAVTGGTATGGGVDYTLAAGTLTFLAGQTSKTISVPTKADTLFEGNETVVLALSRPSGRARLGTRSTTTLTIVDNDIPGTMQFSSSAYQVAENVAGGVFNLVVTRTGTRLASNVTVDYTVTGGTATGGGVDYTLAAGTLTFAAAQTSLPIPVRIVNDGLREGNETVIVTLRNPSSGAYLGTIKTTTLTIVDDEPAP